MNAKEILLKLPSFKEDNKTVFKEKNENNYSVFRKYLGEENYNLLLSTDNNNFMMLNNKKVEFIFKKITNSNYKEKIYNEIFEIYKSVFSKYITDKTKYLETNIVKIKKNLSIFFELQKNYNKVMNILGIINFQSLFIEYFEIYFSSIISDKKASIHQEIYSLSSNIFQEEEEISNFVEKYLEKYDVEFIKRHEVKKQVFAEKDSDIFDFLQKIFNELLKKIQKKNIRNQNNKYNILTYGSYTSHKINPEVTYNDIDVYSSNPLSFLVTFLVIVKIIFDIDIDIFKIPYVLGHVSLRYKGVHFADCLFIDEITLKKIPIVRIKETMFVHPIIQVLNFFRLISEPRRMFALSEKKENTNKKLSALIQYTCEWLDINIEKDLSFIELDIKTYDNSFVINLKKILKNIQGYDNIKDEIEFDYLIISRYAPKLFLEFLKNKNPIIRKQWFGLFNEIVVEFYNKKISKETNINKKKLNKTIIRESKMLVSITEESNDKIIDNFINNNNVILMSNFTTEFYMKVTKDKTGLIKSRDVTNITKETCLSSFLLSQILTHFKNKELVKFYFLTLLSFIKHSDGEEKERELNILTNKTKEEDVYIASLSKNKLNGKHETFQLSPSPYLKKIFFYKKQTEDVYNNYQEFLDLTMYNV